MLAAAAPSIMDRQDVFLFPYAFYHLILCAPPLVTAFSTFSHLDASIIVNAAASCCSIAAAIIVIPLLPDAPSLHFSILPHIHICLV